MNWIIVIVAGIIAICVSHWFDGKITYEFLFPLPNCPSPNSFVQITPHPTF